MTQLIDYAKPMMMAEQAMRRMHDACLLRQYKHAAEEGLNAIADLKLAVNSIIHIMEEEAKQNGVQ